MVRQLKASAALAEVPALVPSTPLAAHNCNSSSKALFWSPPTPSMHVEHTHREKQNIHRHKIYKKKKFKVGKTRTRK